MPNGVLKPDFIGGSYQLDVLMASPELSENMYVEAIGSKDASSYTNKILRSIDGNKAVLTFPEGVIGCRGLTTVGAGPDYAPDMYAVFNDTLYRINADLSKIAVGKIGATNTPVRFTESGGVNSHLCLVNGQREMRVCSVHALDEEVADTFDSIPLPKNPYDTRNQDYDDLDDGISINATHIITMGERVIVNDSESGFIFLSRPGAFQGGTYKAFETTTEIDSYGDEVLKIVYEADGVTPKYKTVTDASWGWKDRFGRYQFQHVMSANGDVVKAIETINAQELWVFGNKSFDIWGLSSDEEGNYSLTRTGMGTNIGISAPQSLAKIQNKICWLGSGGDGDNAVWAATQSAQPQRISTPALERYIAKVKSTDAFGFAYNYSGHAFYVLSLPTANRTFCYDFTTGMWHNRSTRDANTNTLEMWYPSFACNFNGEVYFGTYKANALVVMDQNKHTEWDGRRIRRLRRSPVIVSDMSNIIVDMFRIECGTGLTTELQPTEPIGNNMERTKQGFNPKVSMRYSYDGGNTWSFYGESTLGRAGQYNAQCEYYGLGMGRLFVIEVSCDDPVDFVITTAKIKARNTRSF
jgi:hypothetical protein